MRYSVLGNRIQLFAAEFAVTYIIFNHMQYCAYYIIISHAWDCLYFVHPMKVQSNSVSEYLDSKYSWIVSIPG